MFLTTNNLKKKKNVDDGIEYLNYMKYSHLDIPEIKNTSIQTGIDTNEKGTDTMDELNSLKGIYRVILEEAKAFPHRKVDKQVQVFTEMLDRTKPRKPPSPPSSDTDKEYPMLNTVANVAYYTGKGLYHTGKLGLKAVGKAVDVATRGREEEGDEESNEETQPTTTFLPSTTARQRSRSRDDYENAGTSSNAPPPNNMANRFLRRGASRSRSSTPKGYPRKKK